MNAIYFDADKWHQKLLEEEKFFDELTALANDTGAATSHLDELDTTDPFTKNYLRAKTIECVFHTKPATDSRVSLPPIPYESCH